MKKLLLIIPILLLIFTLTSCGRDTGDTNGNNQYKDSVFKNVRKACDGNDLVFLLFEDRGNGDIGGISVVPNHPDCITESTQS